MKYKDFDNLERDFTKKDEWTIVGYGDDNSIKEIGGIVIKIRDDLIVKGDELVVIPNTKGGQTGPKYIVIV